MKELPAFLSTPPPPPPPPPPPTPLLPLILEVASPKQFEYSLFKFGTRLAEEADEEGEAEEDEEEEEEEEEVVDEFDICWEEEEAEEGEPEEAAIPPSLLAGMLLPWLPPL